jgi:hypothetical protein
MVPLVTLPAAVRETSLTIRFYLSPFLPSLPFLSSPLVSPFLSSLLRKGSKSFFLFSPLLNPELLIDAPASPLPSSSLLLLKECQ